MVLKEKSTFRVVGGTTLTLSIPKSIAEDSAFPFKSGDEVEIELVNGKTLLIRKWAKEAKT